MIPNWLSRPQWMTGLRAALALLLALGVLLPCTATSCDSSTPPDSRISSRRQSTRSPLRRAPWVGASSGTVKRATKRALPSGSGRGWACCSRCSTKRLDSLEPESATRYCASRSTRGCCAPPRSARAGRWSETSSGSPARGVEGRRARAVSAWRQARRVCRAAQVSRPMPTRTNSRRNALATQGTSCVQSRPAMGNDSPHQNSAKNQSMPADWRADRPMR